MMKLFNNYLFILADKQANVLLLVRAVFGSPLLSVNNIQ